MSTVAQAPKTLPAGAWNADPVHSHVGFAVEYLVGTFHGSFSPVEATLEVDRSRTRISRHIFGRRTSSTLSAPLRSRSRRETFAHRGTTSP